MKCNPWVGGNIGRRGFPMLGTGKRGLSTYVKELFKNGEQGFFYDPNDLSTMYQDAVGTVPVTGVGQPVGLILDKSKGLVLGNDLVVNGGFDSTNNWVLSTGHSIAAGKLSFDNTSAAVKTVQKFVTGCFYEIEVSIESITSGRLRAVFSGSAVGYVTTAGVHKFRCLASLSGDPYVYLGTGGVLLTATIDYVKVRQIEGNHAYQTTSASRPILRKNAVTGAYYLEFDGSDDFLRTNNINFTGTDKVNLFAGVRKLSDNAQIVAELSEISNFNDGAFYFAAGTDSGGIGYTSMARGTAFISPSQIAGSFTHLAPDTAVLSVKHDISNSLSGIRRNGVAGTDGTGDKGTGNFDNYPLYIGRRGGTSIPFNGHIYSLIGVGRLTSGNETADVEKELAKRTGVTLNV